MQTRWEERKKERTITDKGQHDVREPMDDKTIEVIEQ